MSNINTYTGKAGRPRKYLANPTRDINGITINTQAYDRIPVIGASCKCRFLIDTVEQPNVRCGLCGSALIYSYKHDKLVLAG